MFSLCLAVFTQYYVCEIQPCFVLSGSLFFLHCFSKWNDNVDIFELFPAFLPTTNYATINIFVCVFW